jgi:lipoprotein-releasing system permease protein
VQLAKVTDQYIHFFDWFVILNRNVIIFLSVILFVACFNTMSILLILIMERTSMIGMLKALGASQKQIQAIFLYNGLQILWKGLLVGNILALSLAWVQDTFKLFTLDAVTYYMDTVPIAWDLGLILWLNLAVICLVCLVLFIPVQIILRISPMKAIRFD